MARHIPLGESGQAAITDNLDDPLCPRCGQAVPVTAGDREAGDQLALSVMNCPSCGARLVRAIEGHGDGGWRLAD